MSTKLISSYTERDDNEFYKFISLISFLAGLTCPRVAHIQSLIQEEIT